MISDQEAYEMAKYCCCFSNQQSTSIVIGIVWFIIDFLINVPLATNLDIQELNLNLDQLSPELRVIHVLLAVIIFPCVIAVDACLIYGAVYKVECLLMTWTIVKTIFSVLVLICLLMLWNPWAIGIGAFFVITKIWAIFTVNNAIQEIKDEKRNIVKKVQA